MKIYSVSEFNRETKELLEQTTVAIQGEVIDFRVHQERLVFFDLKDEESRITCFLLSFQLKVLLEDGMEIKVIGSPSLFLKSGKFNFKVRKIELVGEGTLAQALKKLKEKLEKEGLFAEDRKRPLPDFPGSVGIITSPQAAAFTDVKRILKNRWGGLEIFLTPVGVQGTQAIGEIVSAIKYFNSRKPVDVIILTRGGGSLEDLQAFNSEEVARAIFASKIPIVCGVGHERDWTIADFVTDQRASTPSNAAEIVVPDRRDVLYQIQSLVRDSGRGLENLINSQKQQISNQIIRLEEVIRGKMQEFENEEQNLKRHFLSFSQQIDFRKKEARKSFLNLKDRIISWLENLKKEIIHEEQLLKTLNPENVLARGYSITANEKGEIIKSIDQIKKDDKIKTRLKKGKLTSKVIRKEK